MNAELIEKIKEYVAECSYDPSGQMIWTKERKHLCDIRGWGNLRNKFSTEDEAATFQDGIGLFIQQAINERASLRVAEANKWVKVNSIEDLPTKECRYWMANENRVFDYFTDADGIKRMFLSEALTHYKELIEATPPTE